MLSLSLIDLQKKKIDAREPCSNFLWRNIKICKIESESIEDGQKYYDSINAEVLTASIIGDNIKKLARDYLFDWKKNWIKSLSKDIQ